MESYSDVLEDTTSANPSIFKTLALVFLKRLPLKDGRPRPTKRKCDAGGAYT